MAKDDLTKEIEYDKIEVVSTWNINVRKATKVMEEQADGSKKELSRSFHRRTVQCGDIDASDNFVDTDISSETTEVKAIAAAVWTQAVKDAWKAHLIASKPS